MAQDHAGPFRGPRPVGCDAPRGRPRARADAVHRRRLLGRRRHLRSGRVHRAARRGRRPAGRAGQGLQPRGRAQDRRHRAARRGRRPRPRSRARGRRLRGHLGRGEAVHAAPGCAVHDLHAPAGGKPEASPLVAADDAHGSAALRERLHHLHAHRLDDLVGVGAHSGSLTGARALRRRRGAGGASPVRAPREERPGGARGDPSGR